MLPFQWSLSTKATGDINLVFVERLLLSEVIFYCSHHFHPIIMFVVQSYVFLFCFWSLIVERFDYMNIVVEAGIELYIFYSKKITMT